MRSGWKAAAAALALVALAAVAVRAPIGGWATALVGTARQAGAPGVLLFSASYLAAPLLLLPASLLTLGAGFLYGPLWGTLLVSPLSVAAATIAFLLGRTLAREALERKLAGDPRFEAIDRAVGAGGARILVLLRLSPVVPFALLNYGMGLTRIRLRTYVLASFVGMLPGTFLYVSLGSAATDLAHLGQPAASPAARALFWIGIAATAAAVVWLTRFARRALERALREASP